MILINSLLTVSFWSAIFTALLWAQERRITFAGNDSFLKCNNTIKFDHLRSWPHPYQHPSFPRQMGNSGSRTAAKKWRKRLISLLVIEGDLYEESRTAELSDVITRFLSPAVKTVFTSSLPAVIACDKCCKLKLEYSNNMMWCFQTNKWQTFIVKKIPKMGSINESLTWRWTDDLAGFG